MRGGQQFRRNSPPAVPRATSRLSRHDAWSRTPRRKYHNAGRPFRLHSESLARFSRKAQHPSSRELTVGVLSWRVALGQQSRVGVVEAVQVRRSDLFRAAAFGVCVCVCSTHGRQAGRFRGQRGNTQILFDFSLLFFLPLLAYLSAAPRLPFPD